MKKPTLLELTNYIKHTFTFIDDICEAHTFNWGYLNGLRQYDIITKEVFEEMIEHSYEIKSSYYTVGSIRNI